MRKPFRIILVLLLFSLGGMGHALADAPPAPQQAVVSGGQRYTVVPLDLPHSMHPRDMNLVESGFAGAESYRESDKLWKYDPDDPAVGEILWYDTGRSEWRMRTGQEDVPVPERYFDPNDTVVILTRRSADVWTWMIPARRDAD